MTEKRRPNGALNGRGAFQQRGRSWWGERGLPRFDASKKGAYARPQGGAVHGERGLGQLATRRFLLQPREKNPGPGCPFCQGHLGGRNARG